MPSPKSPPPPTTASLQDTVVCSTSAPQTCLPSPSPSIPQTLGTTPVQVLPLSGREGGVNVFGVETLWSTRQWYTALWTGVALIICSSTPVN